VRNRGNYKDFRNVYAESFITDLSTSVTVCSSRCRLSVWKLLSSRMSVQEKVCN